MAEQVLVCGGCGSWVDPSVWCWCPDCGGLLQDIGPAIDLTGDGDVGDDGFAVDWAQPA